MLLTLMLHMAMLVMMTFWSEEWDAAAPEEAEAEEEHPEGVTYGGEREGGGMDWGGKTQVNFTKANRCHVLPLTLTLTLIPGR